MAWVGPYVEDFYGSGLTIHVEGSVFRGTYTPPTAANEAGLELIDSTRGVETGKAELAGSYERTLKGIFIRGTWTHVDGPMCNGDFEMSMAGETEDLAQRFEGWWRERKDDDSRWGPQTKWVWQKLASTDLPRKERFAVPLEAARRHTERRNTRKVTLSFEKPIIESFEIDMENPESLRSKLTDEPSESREKPERAGPRRNSLSGSIGNLRGLARSSSFVIDLGVWTKFAWFVISVYMERYGMICAWLFFWQTLTQLVSLHQAFDANTILNVVFNGVYTATYASFLIAYCAMYTPPDWKYVMGVFLYFLGYVCFFVLYWQSHVELTWYLAELYHAGSWLFLTGSVFLMVATTPAVPKTGLRYSPLHLGTSLWWGSTMFFIGSVLFASDAAGMGFQTILEDKDFGQRVNCLLGLFVFTLGRIFFIRGSQTRRVDFFFRSDSSTARLRRRLTRRPSFSLMRRNTRVFGGVMPAQASQ